MGKDTGLSICVDIVKKNVIINPIFAPEHSWWMHYAKRKTGALLWNHATTGLLYF